MTINDRTYKYIRKNINNDDLRYPFLSIASSQTLFSTFIPTVVIILMSLTFHFHFNSFSSFHDFVDTSSY